MLIDIIKVNLENLNMPCFVVEFITRLFSTKEISLSKGKLYALEFE